MKINIIICIAIQLILTACGTNNYRNLKFQKEQKERVEENSSTTTKTLPNRAESNSSPISTAIEPIEKVNITTSENVELASNSDEKNISTKPDNLIIQKQSQNKQVKTDDEEVLDTKFATGSALFGGLSFIPIVGWVFSILAVVFGIIAIHKARNYPGEYGGLKKGIVGIILGVTSLTLGIILTFLIFFVWL